MAVLILGAVLIPGLLKFLNVPEDLTLDNNFILPNRGWCGY